MRGHWVSANLDVTEAWYESVQGQSCLNDVGDGNLSEELFFMSINNESYDRLRISFNQVQHFLRLCHTPVTYPRRGLGYRCMGAGWKVL